MSTSHLRIVVVGLSLIVAVLAGLLSGWAAGAEACAEDGPSLPTPFSTATPDPDPTGGGNEKTFGPVPGDSARPGGGGGYAEVAACGGGFSPGAALVGFGGALLAGLAAGAVALLVPRRD
ncbi:MAG TPA: hypothetical protein VGR21_06835, partial [Cryptosporangiaceae bacterium]|nr:hypothetical protein [Cryptosporangiaceae bacterium]